MPRTALAAGVAALSMAGVPLTLGFVVKDVAYEALLHAGSPALWLLGLTLLANVLLGLAALLVGILPFAGDARKDVAAHEPPWPLWISPAILAVIGAIAGIAPSILDAPLSAAASVVGGESAEVSLRLWHGFTPVLLLSALTLAGLAGAYAIRGQLGARLWKPHFGTEDLYGGTLAALDAISRRIAPPLHSASLRSYVMVTVSMSVAVVGAALVTDPGLGSLVPRTSIALHEILVVIVIIVGALAAASAQSPMTAVLSLGAVGYGVATIFLSYGAPDLAMTQFSVETLTVLIYVLVFRNFSSLGDLSPRLIRYRDAVIAAGIGTLIGGVVLSVSTTDTAPRLREYFAAFGPTLGHGRNIDNVILVDFRAIDTLGEITVLATAAIGVRALLGLAAAEGATGVSGRVVTSTIFRTAARLLMPLLLLFSAFLLMRGHNDPGGGFVGGLVAAAAFALYSIAFGAKGARKALIVDPQTLLGTGLLVALLSGIPAVLSGQPFLTALWMGGDVPLGTPIIFDVGVFLVVTGVVLMMFFNLAEEP
jgi:multicomponent Na+:H+ antiporter subunit A